MATSTEMLAAFRELTTTKQLDRAELLDLLHDGIQAALVRKYGPTVRFELSVDELKIDATGDGDVAARSGAPFELPVAPGMGDRMGTSLMYRVAGAPPSLSGIRVGDKVVRCGPGFMGDGLDVDVLTKAEIETRLKLWEAIGKLKAEPGHKDLSLIATGTGIAVRETRRIVGEYTVTEQDAIKGARFPDVVAISSNPFPGYKGKRFIFEHEGFDVPYRSLVPKRIDGLVLTGRCIAAEQAPFQSARSMAPAMAVGHAS